MMISNEISASSDIAQWQATKWKAVEVLVLKLQIRIAKVIKANRFNATP